MTDWLLDTNALSELRRPKPEPNVVIFVAATALNYGLTVVSLDTTHYTRANADIQPVDHAKPNVGVSAAISHLCQCFGTDLRDYQAIELARPMFRPVTFPL